jgi:hypothetical protein
MESSTKCQFSQSWKTMEAYYRVDFIVIKVKASETAPALN